MLITLQVGPHRQCAVLEMDYADNKVSHLALSRLWDWCTWIFLSTYHPSINLRGNKSGGLHSTCCVREIHHSQATSTNRQQPWPVVQIQINVNIWVIHLTKRQDSSRQQAFREANKMLKLRENSKHYEMDYTVTMITDKVDHCAQQIDR